MTETPNWPAEDYAQPADNLRDTILELAAKDRENTLHNVMAALEQLGVIRPAQVGMVYDHRIIGSHKRARAEAAEAIGKFMLEAGAIDFRTGRDPMGGGTALSASLTIVLPVRLQQQDEPAAEPAGSEVPN